MSNRLLLRVELNKGRLGIPLSKLSKVAGEIESFLKLFCEDLEIDHEKGKWIALNFQNSSVIYDAEFIGDSTESQQKDYHYYLEKILTDPINVSNGKIKRKTVLQYANIAHSLDPDEPIGLGIYRGDYANPTVFKFDRKISSEITSAIENKVEYYGALQGMINGLYNIASEKPYFKLRDTISTKLINCYFADSFYNAVVDLLKMRNAIIHISGIITASRIDRQLECVFIRSGDKIELAEQYKPGDLDKFFGSIPDILEGRSLRDYMGDVRSSDE